MHGPYVQVAAVVERVLHETNAVVSLIRVIDRLNINVHGDDPPAELPDGELNLTLVVMLKSGDARGRHGVTIQPELPSGQSIAKTSVDLLFEGEDRGVNLIVDLHIPSQEGLYWFEVMVGDRVLSRVPFRVIYQRLPA